MAIYPSIYYWRQSPGHYQRLGCDYNPTSGYAKGYVIPPAHERSRGKHSPGSGPYWNRYAFGGEVTNNAPVDRNKLCLSCDDTWDPGELKPTGYWKPGSTSRIIWTGQRYLEGTVGVTNWSGPTGGQVKVEFTAIVVDRYSYSTRWDQVKPFGKKGSINEVFGDQSDKNAWLRARAKFMWAFEAYLVASINSDLWTSSYEGYWEFKSSYQDLLITQAKLSLEIPQLIMRIEENDPTLAPLYKAVANAYVDCIDQLPTLMSQNNIANILDVMSTLRSFISGFSSTHNLVKLASSAWMGYRYAYGTTRADIEEGAELLERLGDLLKSTALAAHGIYREGEYTVRCVINLTMSEFDGLMPKIEKWGLALNAYALWDMVPYSFIIDWFTDIGGWLEFSEKQKVAYRIPPQDCWYSIEREFTNEFGFRELYYQRFRWDVYPSLANYTSHSASGVTIVKRGIDLLAMFAG